MSGKARWIPWVLAASLLPVLAVNGLLIRMALQSSTGLVSDNAFDTGQAYNRVIAAGQRQRVLGWTSAVLLSGDAARAKLSVTLTDEAGNPLRGATVEGRLYSPVDPQPDQTVSLSESGDGQYRLELSLPRGGQWQAQLMARRGDDSLAIDQRLILP